jgi:hypothetical protein
MVQEINMTKKEKYRMYMSLKKSKLAKMLGEYNTQLNGVLQSLPYAYYIERPNAYSSSCYPNAQSAGSECTHCGRSQY